MLRTGLLIALLAAASAADSVNATPEITWRESRYNPKPALGDLILPLPCGGAIAFRAVATPHSGGALGDLAIEIGGEADEYGYLRGRRRAYVAGPFRDENDFDVFYIAKYEIAKAQFDVVMSDECPEKKPRKRDFVPASGLSWFDSVSFTENYSIWLRENASVETPKVNGAVAYLRLPTEAEWEFAARGGAVVSKAAFREPVYPLDGRSLAEFEAYGASSSANGKVQPIGSLEPNPLGLHDMLGNVSEMTIEPFRLIRQGRIHGRVGGFVKRGGDANADVTQVNSSARQEIRFFDPTTGAAVRDKYVGFRPVLAVIAIDSEAAEARYAEASQRAAAPDLQTRIGAEEAKALASLEAAASIEDPGSRKLALLEIARTLDAARAERNQQRDRAIESLFLAAGSACASVSQQLIALNVLDRRVETALNNLEPVREMKKRGELDDELLRELRRAEKRFRGMLDQRDDIEQRIRGYMDTYSEFINTLQSDYGPDVTEPQSDLLRRKIGSGGPRNFGNCIGLSTAHLSDARASGRLSVARWRVDIEDLTW